MSADELQLHGLFVEFHDAYQANQIEDAKAGLELFEEELNTGAGIYSLTFYTRATLAAEQLARLITAAETGTEQGVA